MKKWVFPVFLLLFFSIQSSAQWVWAPLNTGQAADETYLPTTKNVGFFANGINSYCSISDTSESVDGNGAFNINYHVEAYDFWGGYVDRIHTRDLAVLGRAGHYDLSNGKYISFWIKVTGLPVKDQPGDVKFEFKLKEKRSADTGEDRWLYDAGQILDTLPGDWQQIIVPLDEWHFSTQATDENGEWEPWNIYGWEIAVVYISAGNSTEPPTATGSFLMDKIQILGQRYEPLMSFDNQADTTNNLNRKEATWLLNDMADYPEAVNRHLILSNEPVDTVQGSGALSIDYAIVSPQNWGGYAELEHVFPGTINLSVDSYGVSDKLVFYVKNLVAAHPTTLFLLRVELWDELNGVQECWSTVAPVDFDSTFDWEYIQLPFIPSKESWDRLSVGDIGWAQRDAANDGIFDPTHISKLRLSLIVLRTAVEPLGPSTIVSGKFLLDLMTGSGFSHEKGVPPAPPDVTSVKMGLGHNVVNWEPVPNEEKETYSVFWSNSPITNLKDNDVYLLISNVNEYWNSADHYILDPGRTNSRNYYYAVLCSDKYGNTDSSNFGSTEIPIETEPKKVPIMQPVTSFGFKADGSFDEWSGIEFWTMKPSDGSGTIMTFLGQIEGDQDLSAKIGIAHSADSLFIGIQVTDDIIHTDSTAASFNQDAVDFFFGAYEFEGKDHIKYRRGEKPDYHFRFNSNRVSDDLTGNTVAWLSSPDYDWKQVTGGYHIEWKTSWVDLASTHPGDHAFSGRDTNNYWPYSIYSVPIDWIINDADATGSREGGLRWAPSPDDNGWNNVQSWSYSFLFTPPPMSVENEEIPLKLLLHPNYPNPFNPETTIRYNLPVSGFVSLSLYDVTGREIKKLVNGFQPAGEKSFQFNGSGLASGLYFLRLTQAGKSEFRKMMLLK